MSTRARAGLVEVLVPTLDSLAADLRLMHEQTAIDLDAVWPGAVHGLVLVATVPARRVDQDAPALVEPDQATGARADRAARRALVDALHRGGLSGSAIATRLGMPQRQVERDLAVLKAAAA